MSSAPTSALESIAKIPMTLPWNQEKVVFTTHIGTFTGQKTMESVQWQFDPISGGEYARFLDNDAESIDPLSFGNCLRYVANEIPDLKLELEKLIAILFVAFGLTPLTPRK